MSEEIIIGFLGAVLGATIATVPQFIFEPFNHIRWKKEQKIKYLMDKKGNLKNIIEATKEQLNKGLKEDKYPSDMISNFEYLCPKKTYNLFFQMMQDNRKKDNPELQSRYYLEIMRRLKRDLANINKEIEKLLKIE